MGEITEGRMITVTDIATGKGKEKFIFNLKNIRSLKGFLKGFWDLSVYDKCFAKRNKLSDIDGQVEIEGHILQIEFKETVFSATKGQTLKAIRMAKHANTTTVMVFGKQDNPEYYQVYSPEEVQKGNLSPEAIPCNQEELQAVFKAWNDMALANSLVTGREDEWNAANRIAVIQGTSTEVGTDVSTNGSTETNIK